MISEIAPGRVVRTDIPNAQVAVLKNTSNQTVLEYALLTGFDAYLAFVGDAWDSGLDTNLTKRVMIDGGVIWDFKDSTVQFAPPENSDREISPWIPLQQGGTLRYEVDVNNAAAVPAGGGNVTVRFKIKYVVREN